MRLRRWLSSGLCLHAAGIVRKVVSRTLATTTLLAASPPRAHYPQTPVLAVLLATLPCLSLRCNTFYDGCPEPPCAGQYRGGLALRPTTGRWLPLPAPDTISFINANGFRARLDLLPSLGADSVTLSALTGVPPSYDENYLNPFYTP